jgi:hypothetical protein
VRSSLLCCAVLLAGCLGKKEVERARRVAYQTDFARVWQVVSDETRGRYTPPDMLVEDATTGELETAWVKVALDDDDRLRTTTAQGAAESRIQAGEGSGAVLLRIRVKVTGGPPWSVVVDGKGARWVPNLVEIIPYSRNGADEPAIIQARIDGLTVAIYRKLEKYAVEVKSNTPAGKKAMDTAKFGDVPPEAARVVGAVQSGARKRELESLRPLLAPEFVWSEGAGGSAEGALALWGADPSALTQLATLLEKGCGHHAAEKIVTCPAASAPDGTGTGPRAGFRLVGNEWLFAFFLRE